MSSLLVLFHTMDPRGSKLGGIETHVRLVLARHPEAMSILFVGLDENGDLTLGKPIEIKFEGRKIGFLPVVQVTSTGINKAAKRIGQSTTLRYALGLLRHLRAIRLAVRNRSASCEIERYEFALIPKLLGLPLVVLAHNEGTSADQMDSLLKRFWWMHLLNERVAFFLAKRIFAVNPSIKDRIDRLSPRLGAKTEVMSVSVDTDRFAPAPFGSSDDAFHVCFAGRLDAFKDPPLMFAAIARLAEKLTAEPVGRFRRVIFDYIGASDPSTIAGFDNIALLTVRHGICTAPQVAGSMRRAHAGIITSFFEGMPCYLLEMLASGRPIVAIRLPQFDPLVIPSVSGQLIERQPNRETSADALAQAFVALSRAIDANSIDPVVVARLAQPYSIKAQMHRLFTCHEALAAGVKPQTRYASESMSSA